MNWKAFQSCSFFGLKCLNFLDEDQVVLPHDLYLRKIVMHYQKNFLLKLKPIGFWQDSCKYFEKQKIGIRKLLLSLKNWNMKRSFCIAPQVIFTNGATATTLVATTACGIPQKDKIDRIYNRCSGKHLTKNEAFTRLSEIISKGALLFLCSYFCKNNCSRGYF